MSDFDARQNPADAQQSRLRVYTGPFDCAVTLLLVVWTLFQLYFNTAGVLDAMRLRAVHALFLLICTFLLYPATRRERGPRTAPPLWDILLVAAAAGAFGYLLLNFKRITLAGGYLQQADYVAAAVGLLVVFEAARRACGNLAVLALVFLCYNFLGPYLPGPLGHNGFSVRRVLKHLFWGSQGIFGVGIGVSAGYIFLFVLFGAFLKHSGFSGFINELALTLVGRSPGGPAKVAVLASALLGMMNGSAVANVATTGSITIPLMKRTGYSAEFSGAVEAVASTGGQFAPPIMGAVGFVMAEFMGVSYTKVMLAALFPALLYYLALLLAVHFAARRQGLMGLPKKSIPNARTVLRARGHLFIALAVLIGMMLWGYTPLYAAAVALFATVAASWLRRETRMTPAIILKATLEGARGAVGVGMACVIIGVIIGTVSLTGLGQTFGYLVLRVVGEGQLLLGGVMVMLMSIILGMGVPGVAAYVIVATVAVPVLVQVGAQPMAAHMFCLIYACLSNITPPVAMSSYVAAGIAGADQTKTSLIAVRLGAVGFLLPFFFLDNPLLLYGSGDAVWFDTLRALLTAALGCVALAAALEGMLLRRCGVAARAALLAAALCCIATGLGTDVAGLALFAVVLLWQRRGRRARDV